MLQSYYYLAPKVHSKKISIVPLSLQSLHSAIELVNLVFPKQPFLEQAILALPLSLTPLFLSRNTMMVAGIKDAKYWVTLNQKQVIGIAGVYAYERDDFEACWLGWFCVAPQHRGRGIGRQLLNYAILHARFLEKQYLRLYTSNNPTLFAAQRLFDDVGLKISQKKTGKQNTFIYREMKL